MRFSRRSEDDQMQRPCLSGPGIVRLWLMGALFFQLNPELVAQSTSQSREPGSRYRDAVRSCVETLLKHGTDRYGAEHSPLIMAVIDTRDRQSPADPATFDSLVRLEDRLHRRGERGSNLWYDQSLLRTMVRLSEVENEPRYHQAAESYVRYFYEHCRKPVQDGEVYANGMPAWGSHVYWDCYLDRPAGDGDGIGPHEPLVYQAEWQLMHGYAPSAVKAHVDGIWQFHIVDKRTGQHNRHDDGQAGCDFAFAGATFMHAFAAMAACTGKAEYVDRAKLVADWHWRHRDPQTGLVADAPSLTSRYDGQHCMTTIIGPHSAALLRCFEITGDRSFLDKAIAYLKAYDRYAWDEQHENYYAMLQLDGTPVLEREKGTGYDAWAPYGHVNVWRTSIFSYEFTLAAAQSAVWSWELSRDASGDRDDDLLVIAKRWATAVEKSLPPSTGRRWKKELEQAMPEALRIRGVYAEDYGRAVSLFVHMYRATGDSRYLDLARDLADEAIERLQHNGLFRGHPAKPYYETTNGVGLLLWALLELDSPDEPLRGAF